MSITRGIVGCWSPSLGASGYLLRDVSGLNNHGTLTNVDPGTNWVASEKGLALDFDSVDDSVTMRNIAFLDAAAEATFCVWFRPNGTTGANALVNQWNVNSPQAGCYLFQNNNTIAWQVGNAFGVRLTTGSVLTSNQWHFVVATHRPSEMQIFINAIRQANTNSVGVGNSRGQNVLIGGINGGLSAPNGQIGEVAIFTRSLTAPEIAELYRRGNGWLGRELTGMNQRRTYAKKLGNRRRRLLCGGMT